MEIYLSDILRPPSGVELQGCRIGHSVLKMALMKIRCVQRSTDRRVRGGGGVQVVSANSRAENPDHEDRERSSLLLAICFHFCSYRIYFFVRYGRGGR